MGIGPRQDLTDSQAGQAGLVPHAATPGEQLGQGGTALQATVSLTQGIVDRPPGFARSPVNLPRQVLGPLARAGVVLVGPGQDLTQR